MTLKRVEAQRFDEIFKKIEWIVCPSCKKEWNKLAPCGFYDFKNGVRQDTVSYLCPDCAETMRGLSFCVSTWPVASHLQQPVISVEWPEDGCINWEDIDGERIYRWERLRGIVKWWDGIQMGEAEFEAVLKLGNGSGIIKVFEKGSDDVKTFGTIVKTWHYLKSKIESVAHEIKEPANTDFRRE